MKVKKFMSTILLLIVAFVTSLTFAYSAVSLRCVVCNQLLVRTNLVLGMLDYTDYFGCQEIDGLKTRRDLAYVGYRLLCIENDDGPLCFSCANQIINEKAIARDTEYSITVPESVVLNKTTSDYSGTYTGTASITASGFIQLDQRVYFTASNPEMRRTGSKTVKGTATATTATDWESMDVSSGDAKTEYTVSANITPGDWTGTMTFYATVSEKYDIALGDNTNSLLTQNEDIANIKFSSSAPEIATVDRTGRIQTVSAGNTTITKMVYDSTGENLLYTSIYDITVSVKIADMVTTRLIEPLKTITAAGTTIDTIQFGQYTIPSGTITYDVSGDGSNTIKAFVDGTALKVTNTKASPVTFAAGNSLSFEQNSAFANIKAIKYESVDTSKVTSAYGVFKSLRELEKIEGLEKWDTSNVTDMSEMFHYCYKLSTMNIENFNTSKVTTMKSMFDTCWALTSLDVSKWDTSNVTDMSFMFAYNIYLTTVNVSTLNTSKVTTFYGMFYSSSKITSLDVSKWDTSNVTNMSMVFADCNALTSLDVSKWVTSKVTTMNKMFYNCQKLLTIDVSKWNTENVTNMFGMFKGCNAVTNLPVDSFNTSKVTDMARMFDGCRNLPTIDVSGFNTSNVTDMGSMFNDCWSVTALDVSHFNTSKVTDMSYMFNGCNHPPVIDVSRFDTHLVTSMKQMFMGCYEVTTFDVSNFDTSNVTDMSRMFYYCKEIAKLDISNFDASKVTNYSGMFGECWTLRTLQVNGTFATGNLPSPGVNNNVETGLLYVRQSDAMNLTGKTTLPITISGEASDALKAYDFATDNRTLTIEEKLIAQGTTGGVSWKIHSDTGILEIYPTNGISGVMDNSTDGTGFEWNTYSSSIKSVQIKKGVVANQSISYMFAGCNYISSVDFGGFDTSNTTDMNHMFYNCGSIKALDFASLNTSKVTNMSFVFDHCTNSAFSPNVSTLDVSHVTNASGMFADCWYMKAPDMSQWNTSNFTDTSKMFYNCWAFTTFNINNWDVSNVTNMGYMFFMCKGATSIDLNSWNTSNVTNMGKMFLYCEKAKSINVSDWNVSKVTDMSQMFESCSVLTSIDISKWDVSHVTMLNDVFRDCVALTSIDVSKWNLASATYIHEMFYGCSSLVSIDVSGWDTTNTVLQNSLFANCPKLTTLIVGPKFMANRFQTNGGQYGGAFYISTKTSLTIVGTATSALKSYAFNRDNRTVTFVSSTSLTNLTDSISTPETAMQYDERPAA